MSQPGTKDQWTYFGLWSAKDVQRVSQLLTSLGARFEIDEVQTDQGDLEHWCAWDPTAADPNTGYHLWIHINDLSKVGEKVVGMFSERKFVAR